MDFRLIGIIIGIAFAILLFPLIREFFCWYLKINERKALLEKILAELQTLNGHKPINDSEKQDPENLENNDKPFDLEKEE